MYTILSNPNVNPQLQMQFDFVQDHALKSDSGRVQTHQPVAQFPRSRLVQELGKHFHDRAVTQNQRLFLMTATYTESKKRSFSPKSLASLFERTYVALLRLTVHKHRYHKPGYRPFHPVVYAFLDAPGSKHKTHNNIPRKTMSDGLHHHCIVAVPKLIAAKFDAMCNADPTENANSLNAMKDLVALKSSDPDAYAREIDRITDLKANNPRKLPAAFLKSLHIEPIDPAMSSLEKVIDYATYYACSLSSQHADYSMLIYPKSSSECQPT